jgi:hypothetical protein
MYKNIIIIKDTEKIKKGNFIGFYLKIGKRPPKYFKTNKIEFFTSYPVEKEDIICEARFFKKEKEFLLVKREPVNFEFKSELSDENSFTVF